MFRWSLNDLNLQVVAVGRYDVAGEVAVAAVVCDWKGFWEGFPEKRMFTEHCSVTQMRIKNDNQGSTKPGQGSSLSLLGQFVHYTL